MNSVKTSVGIDVSKAVLDLYAHPTGVSQQVSYDPVGVGGLVAELQALEPDIVVLEATGGWKCRWCRSWRRPSCRW